MNNGFDKAQRDYERMLPEEDDVSDEEETRSRNEAMLERQLAKADMQRDIDKGDMKIGSDIDRYLDKHPED